MMSLASICTYLLSFFFCFGPQAATLPISIQTALDSGKIDEDVAQTILPLGCTINMDGSAIGYPCAVAFLAHTAKLVCLACMNN
jgi:Na+/H+-dicarboxylate symporter